MFSLFLFLVAAGFAGMPDGIGDDVGDMLVGERVDPLAPIGLHPDEPGGPQHPQVLIARRSGVDRMRKSSLAGSYSSCPTNVILAYKHLYMQGGMESGGTGTQGAGRVRRK